MERYGFYECERMEMSVDYAIVKPHEEEGVDGEKGIATKETSIILVCVEFGS